MSTVNYSAAQSTIGFYIRFHEDPSVVQKTDEYKEMKKSIDGVVDETTVIAIHFPNAVIPSLRRTLFLELDDPTVSNQVESLLENSGLFEFAVAITDEVLVAGNTLAPGSEESKVAVITDPPDCNAPFISNDLGVYDTDHFQNMQVPCAWTLTQGNPNISIGVVDWYFDPENPEIASKILPSQDLAQINSSFSASIDPVNGIYTGPEGATVGRHGTAMAAGAAAVLNNGTCLAGTGGESSLRLYTGKKGSILQGITRAVDDGNSVISVSAGQCIFQDTSSESRAMVRDVFLDAVKRGSVISFAVLCNNSIHLEDIPGVLLVGFGSESGAYLKYCDANNKPCQHLFSNIVDTKVEFIVPSTEAYRADGRNSCSKGVGGSSLGAAFMSGIVALMIDQNPCLSPTEIENILYTTSVDVPNRACCHPNRFEVGKGKVNAYQAILGTANPVAPARLIVSAGQPMTIDDEKIKYNDIQVLPGATLNIFDSEINIEGSRYDDSPSGRIVVHRGAKLVVKNSLLTSKIGSSTCDFPRWKGIRVHGNIDKEQPDLYTSGGVLDVNIPLASDDAGVVILLDNTTIENAINAVATSVPGYPYPDQVDRWGGLVIADRAIFRNNFRVAEFLRYPRQFSGNTFKNKSVFNECLFITSDDEDTRSLGITAWDTDGIKVTKSTFKNIGRESLVTIDGSFIVEDRNTFINERSLGDHRHVMLMATYPYSGASVIGSKNGSLTRNEFYSSNLRDIFVSSSTSAGSGGVQVLNNDFYGNDNSPVRNLAVEIDGPSRYEIKGNFVENSKPFDIRNTGVNQFTRDNNVSCNTINNSRGSLAYRQDNTGSKFFNNTFSGLGVSFLPTIYVDGKIDPFQGNRSNPANNKFETTQAVLDIQVTQPSFSFDYSYADRGIPDDVFEPRGESNYSKVETNVEPDFNCSSGKVEGGGIKEQDVLAAQNNYDNIRGYLNPELPEDRWNIEKAKTLRDELLNDFVDSAIEESNLGKINSLLPQIPGPKAKVRHFGACVKLGDHVGANSLLSTISGMGAKYDDFVDVQYINLERLQTTNHDYSLTEADSITLDNIASSESEARGYARALLYLLKGKRYYDVYEQKSAISLGDDEKTTTPSGTVSLLSAHPNPVINGELQLKGEILHGNGRAVLRRMDGSVVSVTSFTKTEGLTVNTPDITGVYFIQVTRGGGTSTVKVIVK